MLQISQSGKVSSSSTALTSFWMCVNQFWYWQPCWSWNHCNTKSQEYSNNVILQHYNTGSCQSQGNSMQRAPFTNSWPVAELEEKQRGTNYICNAMHDPLRQEWQRQRTTKTFSKYQNIKILKSRNISGEKWLSQGEIDALAFNRQPVLVVSQHIGPYNLFNF